jgi:hypothetical protein
MNSKGKEAKYDSRSSHHLCRPERHSIMMIARSLVHSSKSKPLGGRAAGRLAWLRYFVQMFPTFQVMTRLKGQISCFVIGVMPSIHCLLFVSSSQKLMLCFRCPNGLLKSHVRGENVLWHAHFSRR